MAKSGYLYFEWFRLCGGYELESTYISWLLYRCDCFFIGRKRKIIRRKMDFFEGLTYEHLNFIFADHDHSSYTTQVCINILIYYVLMPWVHIVYIMRSSWLFNMVSQFSSGSRVRTLLSPTFSNCDNLLCSWLLVEIVPLNGIVVMIHEHDWWVL